jgi:GDPmannose 4,6-dehydratase
LIEIDARYFRPTEVDILMGDPSKAREKLGWEAKVGFEELVKMMVQGDLK